MRRLILILGLFLIILFTYLIFTKKNNLEIQVSRPLKEETISLDDEYQLYKNYELGFSIKFPKVTNRGNIYCDVCNSNGTNCNNFDNPMSIAQIPNTNKILVDLKFDVTNESINNKNTCNIREYSSKDNKANAGFYNVFSFKNREELQNIVRDLYGKNCNIEKLTLSENGKYKKLVIKNAPSDSFCNFNSGKVFNNINLDENRIIISTTGYQQGLFPNVNKFVNVKNDFTGEDMKQTKYYDGEMIDSVIFFEPIKYEK